MVTAKGLAELMGSVADDFLILSPQEDIIIFQVCVINDAPYPNEVLIISHVQCISIDFRAIVGMRAVARRGI